MSAYFPYMLSELVPVRDSYDPFSRLYDQNFGHGLFNDDLFRRSIMPPPSLSPAILAGYLRPHRYEFPEESGISTVSNQKDQFKVNLDVQQFKPEEINVKVVDHCLVIEGKHEEKQDQHGYISRQFTRRYRLPKDVNIEAVCSNLSSDGVLSIIAPKKAIEDASEIKIPVVQTNKPAIKQSKEKSEEAADKMEA